MAAAFFFAGAFLATAFFLAGAFFATAFLAAGFLAAAFFFGAAFFLAADFFFGAAPSCTRSSMLVIRSKLLSTVFWNSLRPEASTRSHSFTTCLPSFGIQEASEIMLLTAFSDDV
ncbi:MAG: hypothetical protein GC168_01430 [Candidatus Hydrogenedens sp.]|nr:hypothetical protein [Candidatus Hydrogenedens sp.]